jgi:hypothetical protein
MNPSSLELPPTDTTQVPLFTELEQCLSWVKALPVMNPLQTQVQLLKQLQLLNGYTLAGAVRLSLLEALRESIYFAQGESAKKFSGRPLPLTLSEQAVQQAVHGLWEALLTGYLRCLESCLAGDGSSTLHAATICQRALAALTDDYTDLMRAGCQPGKDFWRQAHALYTSAEALAVTRAAVADVLRAAVPMTPAAAYVELMLLAAASLHELPHRQQIWVIRWARLWAGKVHILAAPPALESPALPLCVDLAGSTPAVFRPQEGLGARWLETTELRKSLKRRLTLLAKGDPADTPARLGLGDDCTQPACGEVLRSVYPRWVKGGILRRHERHPMSGTCRFAAGVDVIHYYLSGHQSFKPPGSTSTDDLRRQREELGTFGRIATRFEDDYSSNHDYHLENWSVIEDWGLYDQSADGLRLVRPLSQAGGRLAIGQLVGMQPAGSSGFLLGVVRWTQIADDNLAAGIQLMAGKPLPIAMRRTGVMAVQDQYQPAFLLMSPEAPKQPVGAILPPGSFKPDRIMEAWTEIVTYRVKLKALVERGADYERASCEEAS